MFPKDQKAHKGNLRNWSEKSGSTECFVGRGVHRRKSPPEKENKREPRNK